MQIHKQDQLEREDSISQKVIDVALLVMAFVFFVSAVIFALAWAMFVIESIVDQELSFKLDAAWVSFAISAIGFCAAIIARESRCDDLGNPRRYC